MLSILCHVDDYHRLIYSSIFQLIILTPLFIIAGIQDYKTTQIKGVVCLGIGAATFIHSILFTNSWWTVIFILLCLIMTFGPIELSQFGQADFLMLAHYFTSYLSLPLGITMHMVASIIWLICLIVYVMHYRGEDGSRWSPGKNIMIPALPSYAASVVIVSISRLIFAIVLRYF